MVSAYTLELPIEHLPEKLTDKKRKQTSRLGHEIELFDENGEWLSEVIIPDDTSNVYHLDMTKLITKDAELNIMIRSFVLYLLPRYVPGTVYLYYKTLVYICKSIGGRKSLQSILNDLLIHSVQGPDAIGRCKRFVQFLVLHEYDGLSFEDAAEYLEAQNYSIKSNAYLMLFTMDQDYGPFTREELRVLNDSVSNEDLPLHIRTLLAICLNHGLRTIQLALLKHEDFVKDEKTDVKYLKVPRVKQGAVRRRMEFKYRLLDDRTANLIQQLIQMNEKHLPADIKSCDCPLFLRLQAFADCDSRYGTNVSKLRLYQGEKKSFAYHRGPTLACLLNYYSQYIPLSPRTGREFNLHPYRFRYTLGTNAVLNGFTEEEVADLLDHSSVLCVKHYFRFTLEVWEMLEKATQKRTEQRHFTAAWSRSDDLKGNMYGHEIFEISTFTSIGRCRQDKACHDEPAVACYSCKQFCPKQDAKAHENALNVLKERKSYILHAAPESTASQLDEAIAGCMAAIAYSNGEDVELIYRGSSND
jgi:integrase